MPPVTYAKMYNADYNYGKTFEEKVIDFLNVDNKDPYKPYEDRYSPFDFHNSKVDVELKRRRCKVNQYPTTIFNSDKLCHMTEDKDYVFMFAFLDGLYKWVFSKDEFTEGVIGSCRRGRPEFKKHVHIPIEKLQLVTKDITSR